MITELIEFRLKNNTDEEKLLKETKNFNDFFKNNFKGFIDLETTKNEECWINIMHWDSMEDVQACGKVLKSGPEELAGFYALIDRDKTKLTFLEQKLLFK